MDIFSIIVVVMILTAIIALFVIATEHDNWVSVRTRLPDQSGRYLVTLDNFDVTIAHFTSIQDTELDVPGWNGIQDTDIVIAWQHLPEYYHK
jgi:hypothetical protein